MPEPRNSQKQRNWNTGKMNLTCNFEAIGCCRNWVFSVAGFHLSQWNNRNRSHHLRLCSNPFLHLHHSQRKSYYLKQNFSSSFKISAPPTNCALQKSPILYKIQWTHLHKIMTKTTWPRITNHKKITKHKKILASKIKWSSCKKFQASDSNSWIMAFTSAKFAKSKFWVWSCLNQNANKICHLKKKIIIKIWTFRYSPK